MALGITRQTCGWLLAWSAVFAANLIVPLSMAWDMTSQGGRMGMAGALVGWWVLGALTCMRSRDWGSALVLGGTLVAVTQLYPILQLIAGLIGLTAVARVSGWAEPMLVTPQGLSEIGGFVATAVTGVVLLVIALACGGLLLAMREQYLSGMEHCTGQRP